MIYWSSPARTPALQQPASRWGVKQENQQKHVHKETHEILLIIIYSSNERSFKSAQMPRLAWVFALF